MRDGHRRHFRTHETGFLNRQKKTFFLNFAFTADVAGLPAFLVLPHSQMTSCHAKIKRCVSRPEFSLTRQDGRSPLFVYLYTGRFTFCSQILQLITEANATASKVK